MTDDIGDAWENLLEIPLADPPEHVATIRVAREVVGRRELYQVMRLVSQTAVPTTVQFVFTGAALTPPILVTVGDAAQALSISKAHMLRLIEAGWVTPIRHGEPDTTKPRKAWRQALTEGHWPGWDYRIFYSELVALAEYIKRNEHIPTDEPPPRLRRYHKHQKRVETEDGTLAVTKYTPNITDAVYKLLRDDLPAGASSNELQDRINNWVTTGFVPHATIRNALTMGHKRGWINRERLDRSGMTDEERKRYGERGAAVLWSWVPGAEWSEKTFEKPEGTE